MRGQKRYRHILTAILGAVAVIAIAGATHFFLVHAPQAREELEARWQAALAAGVDVRAAALEQWLDDRVLDARVMAAYPSVHRRLSPGEYAPALTGAAPDHLLGILRDYAVTKDLERVLVVNPGFEVVDASHHGALLDRAHRFLIQAVMASGESIADMVVTGDGRPIVAIAVPVRADGTLLGVIAVDIDPDTWLYPFLASSRLEYRTGEVLLVRRDGDQVTYLAPLRFSEAPPLTRRLRADSGLAVVRVLEGARFGLWGDYRGVKVFAAGSRLSTAPWALVVEVDRDEVYADHRRSLLRAGLSYGMLFLIMASLVAAVWWRQREEVEGGLIRSEDRLSQVLDQANDAVFFIGLDGRILEVNRRAEELYGVRPGALQGRPVTQLAGSTAEVQAQVRERLERLRVDGRIVFRSEHLKADGNVFPVEVSASVATIGPDRMIISVVRDLTARQHAERRLRETSEALQAAIRSSPIPIMGLDRAGHVTIWNPAAERVFGWTAAETVGAPPPIVGPEHAEEFRRLRARVHSGEAFSTTIRRRRRDGELLDLSLHAAPLRDDGGRVTGIMALLEDVTERLRAEEALRASEARFRTLFESSGVGIAVLDPAMVCIAANDALCRALGYSEVELARISLLETTHPDDRLVTQACFDELRERFRDTYRLEKRYVRRNGLVMWAAITATAVRDAAGGFQYAIAVIEDVTDRVQAEAEVRRLNAGLEAKVAERTMELQAANRELEAFSYSVSHDLRAPLRSIDGFSRILMDDHGPAMNPEARRLLGIVRDSTRRMGELIDDLLAFSRAGRHEVRLVPIDMADLARSTWVSLVPPDLNGSVRFTVDPLPPAVGDPALLRQVWANLLSNALKFTGPRPERRVAVRGWREGARVVYEVRDNGVGFDMRHAGKLFGVFQRLHGVEFEGTGVGLALVRRILERHGGSIRAEGVVGEGATVTFTLPAEETVA